MKTAKDLIAEYSNGWDKIYTATAETMLKEYALEVAEAVRDECVNMSTINNRDALKAIDLNQFIK